MRGIGAPLLIGYDRYSESVWKAVAEMRLNHRDFFVDRDGNAVSEMKKISDHAEARI